MALKNQTNLQLKSALANIQAHTEVKRALEAAQALQGGNFTASFVIGAEAGEAINVGIQINDDEGNAITSRVALLILLFDDANGDAFNTDSYTTIAVGTDGAIAEVLADKVLVGVTEDDGDLDIDFTITGAATTHVAVVLPGGKLVISGAVTHT